MKSRVARGLAIGIIALGVNGCVTSRGAGAKASSAPEDGGKQTVLPALGAPIRSLNNETVDVACGVCIYAMVGGDDCPLAAEIDNRFYFVTLKTEGEFDTHGVGLCNKAAKAKVSGELCEQGVVVAAITLLPEA